MKKAEIQVGGLYAAKISGKVVTVRVDAIRKVDKPVYGAYMGGVKYRETTCYDVTNLTTSRKTIFRSAAKFRGKALQPV